MATTKWYDSLAKFVHFFVIGTSQPTAKFCFSPWSELFFAAATEQKPFLDSSHLFVFKVDNVIEQERNIFEITGL